MSEAERNSGTGTSWEKWLERLPKVAGVAAIVLILGYLFVFRALPYNERPDAWGQFGDFMGRLLNPLISLFTLIVAVSVWNLQKTELLETRKAVEEQGKTTEQQRREQRFFDFLTIYQVTLQSISFEESHGTMLNTILHPERTEPTPTTRTGKQAFLFLTSSWRSPIRTLLPLFRTEQSKDEDSNEAPAPKTISEAWDEQSPLLDHYFRTVFTLLREAEPILKEDHFRYIKLFRAQLSRDEVNLLAMNLLYDDEGKKMRPLVARYGMLKHMPANALREVAQKELEPSSFGRTWATQRSPSSTSEEPHAN